MRVPCLAALLIGGLGFPCGGSEVSAWLEKLHDPDGRVRAASSFEYHAPAASDWIQVRRAMRDPSEQVRRSAVWFAGEAAYADKTADVDAIAGSLVESLADSSELVQAYAVISLSKVLRRSPATLVRYMNLMGAVGSERAMRVADLLALAVGAIGPSAMPELLVESSRFETNGGIKPALRMAGRTVTGSLIALLNSQDPVLRSRAAWALGEAGVKDSSVVHALCQALSDRESLVQGAALRALAAVDSRDPDVEVAILALARRNPAWDRQAAEALATVGTPAVSVPFLMRLLAGAPSEATAAARSLGSFGPGAAEAGPALVAKLNVLDASPQHLDELRAVIEAIAKIGITSEAAIPVLIKQVDSGNDTALEILACYPKLQGGLLARLAASSAWSYRSSYLKKALISNLWNSDPAGQKELVELLGSKPADVRARAARLIGLAGEAARPAGDDHFPKRERSYPSSPKTKTQERAKLRCVRWGRWLLLRNSNGPLRGC